MIIVYDEKCQFCIKFSEWCVKHNEKFSTIPIRSKEARQILRAKGIQFIDLQTIHFVDEKEVFNKSRAVFQIFKKLNFPYYFISFGRFLPKTITDYFYKAFAKYRYAIKITN